MSVLFWRKRMYTENNEFQQVGASQASEDVSPAAAAAAAVQWSGELSEATAQLQCLRERVKLLEQELQEQLEERARQEQRERWLREELQHKDELLRKERTKRQKRLIGHIDCLALLAQKDTEAQWTDRYETPEPRRRQTPRHAEEAQNRKVERKLLDGRAKEFDSDPQKEEEECVEVKQVTEVKRKAEMKEVNQGQTEERVESGENEKVEEEERTSSDEISVRTDRGQKNKKRRKKKKRS